MDDQSTSILNRAKDLFQSGSLAEAEEILRSDQGGNTQDREILTFRAYLLYKLGRTEEAESSYRELIALAPVDPDPYANLGLIYYKQSKIREARQVFEKLLELRPDDRKTLRNLGTCYRRLGETARAAECFQRAGGKEVLEPEMESAVKAPYITHWMEESALVPGGGSDVIQNGPGSLVCRFEQKLYFRPSFLAAHRGAIVFSTTSHEARKAARKFGDPGSEFSRAEGNGEITLSGGGLNLKLFHLPKEQGLCVNYPALVACGPELEVSYHCQEVWRKLFLKTRIRGDEFFILAIRGTPTLLSVQPQHSVFVRAETLVAWTEGLEYESEEEPLSSGWAGRWRRLSGLRFEGRGVLLLQELPG